jgi:radical SAM superfamily enzyme YgiQ (UPF0313 family)
MRIALVSPRSTFMSRLPEFRDFFDRAATTSTYRQNWSGLSSALLVLGALTPSEHDVRVIDENLDEVDLDAGYDLVGITMMTQQATRAYELADGFRARGVPVVLGGLHATVLPQEAADHADAVVIGEAETLWPRLLADAARGALARFYAAPRAEPLDLGRSPLPRYELIAGRPYQRVWVQTTRGCPHDCEFCAASKVYGQRYRRKGVDQVVAEVARVRDLFGPVSLGFSDDNMLIHRGFSTALLERLVPFGLEWVAQTDISVARDGRLLELLRRSGCVHLFIGFESATAEGLQGLDQRDWKLRQWPRYQADIARIQSCGIGVMGAFILGLDTDGPEVFERTAEFIIDNRLYDAQISILTPFPGTRLRRRLQRAGRLLPTPWSNYTVFDVNFVHPRLSREELEQGLLDVYRRINSPEIYLRKLEHFRAIFKQVARAERQALRAAGRSPQGQGESDVRSREARA